MKKMILVSISLLLFVSKGAAQSVGNESSASQLEQRMALNAPHLYKSYNTGSMLSTSGAILTIGGVAAIFLGYAVADKETVKNGNSTQVNLSGSGAVVFSVGIVAALVGTPIWIIGSTKKRNARNVYLREYGYGAQVPVHPSSSLQLTSAPNGVGLALVF